MVNNGHDGHDNCTLHTLALVVGIGSTFSKSDHGEIKWIAVTESILLAGVARSKRNRLLAHLHRPAVALVFFGSWAAPSVAHFDGAANGHELKGHTEALEKVLGVHCPVLFLARSDVSGEDVG